MSWNSKNLQIINSFPRSQKIGQKSPIWAIQNLRRDTNRKETNIF